MNSFQQTIAAEVRTTGVGLHSGRRVQLVLRPAPAGYGVVFRRVDLPDAPSLHVSADAVGDTRLASTLSVGDAQVQTVEHLMSACCGMGVDNLIVELDAEELPILDGSAAAFVFLLQTAGIVQQSQPREYLRVCQPVEVRQGDGDSRKYARLEPYDGYTLRFEIAFNHPVADATGQVVEYDVYSSDYATDLARARTFCFTRDVETMRAAGLALGGGLDNALVMGDHQLLNDGLRYQDEFVRHKVLDAIGDLYLAGYPLLARYSAYRSGHALNNLLLRELLSDTAHFEVVTMHQIA